MRAAVLTSLLCLAACAEFPALDDRIQADARDAPYPRLTSIAPLLAQANATPTSNNAVAQDIAGRIAALNARASNLRGPIIETPVRNRMRRGIDSTPLR